MWSLICLRLSTEERLESRRNLVGPDMTTDGRFQLLSWREGGGPIIPPSRKLSGMDLCSGCGLRNENEEDRRRVSVASVWIIASIALADFGEMALRSINVMERACPVAAVPLRSLLCVTAVLELHASTMRWAVALASRGGTILRMMSACTTSSSSVARFTTWAALMRSTVDWLVSISHGPGE